MIRTAIIASLIAMPIAGMPMTVSAASFDCGAAKTPFEHAICDNPELSSADEVLNIAYATALGGLGPVAADLIQMDQEGWLYFAERACTDDAQPLTRGRYDEEGASCLVGLFNARVGVLEGSRMMGGHRWIVTGSYAVQPDPDGASDPDYYWKVATHELSYPLLDEDDAMSMDFSDFITPLIMDEGSLNSSSGGEEVGSSDDQSDTDLKITVSEVTPGRITLETSSYWYGHGAAHGNWGISYLHYMTAEKRGLEAEDLFDKAGWQAKLAKLAFAQLQAQHGEWLQIDSARDIADVVVLPERWSFESDYGLTIQFQPYEVAAYAYGAPTVLVTWDALAELTSDHLDAIRYGN